MTKTKRLRLLEDIYAQVPTTICRGTCTADCSIIPVFPIELERMEQAAGRKLETLGAHEVLDLKNAS